jgi:hypothetical protein
MAAVSHPLAQIPTRDAVEAVRILIKAQEPKTVHPIRQRIEDYVAKRDGKLKHSLWSKPGMALARLVAGNSVVNVEQSAPSRSDLSVLNIQFNDLFDDDKCALSLEELHECETLATWEDVLALKPMLNDLLAVDVTEGRAERVNPIVIRSLYGDSAIQSLALPPFKFGYRKYIEQYTSRLHPLVLDALGMDIGKLFDSNPESLQRIRGAQAQAMLQIAVPEEWASIGLKRIHLFGLGLGRNLNEISAAVGWESKEALNVFNK